MGAGGYGGSAEKIELRFIVACKYLLRLTSYDTQSSLPEIGPLVALSGLFKDLHQFLVRDTVSC